MALGSAELNLLAFIIQLILFILYFLLGPAVWVVFAVGMAISRKYMQLSYRDNDGIPPVAPRVNILIPAKDEGAGIRRCIESALNQNYPAFNVIAIDDRSEDDTGKILDKISSENPRLTTLHIAPGALPPGWTGKCHALFKGAKLADGQFILFVDSDVVLEPAALATTVAVAIRKEYGLLSLFPRMECRTFWESVLMPVAGGALGTIFTVPLANASRVPDIAFANGQFILVRRDAYEKVGGHESVRGQFNEDVMLAHVFKKAGLNPRISFGTDLCTVRMYDSFRSAIRGWSRIFFGSAGGNPRRSLLGLLFLLLCCFPIIPAAAWAIYAFHNPVVSLPAWLWMIPILLHLSLMLILVGIMYLRTRNSPLYALTFPLAAVLLAWILIRSIWLCHTKKVEWRGTQYS